MPTAPGDLTDLDRATLARLGREYMLFGHLYDRALMPQVVLRWGMDEIEPVAIHEWMGASPNYTRRMRRLMGIEGDGVDAICKALQLDVGFPHQYMDVGYEIVDAHHATFWLEHCGALVDVEPMGEHQVVGMCHHIEDPTFDATAVATNPRARIRPIHRPPRVPADRVPHCHWTLTIDPDAEPIVEDPLTTRVGALPIARVANAVAPGLEPGGWDDYSGPFDPSFTLEHLSAGALVAVLREFTVQTHLLSAAAGLTLAERFDPAAVVDAQADQLAGASWVAAERIARVLGLGDGGLEAIAAVVALHPAFPVGIEVLATVDDDGTAATIALRAPTGLLDGTPPGWLGLLADDDPRPLTAIAQAVDGRSRVRLEAPRTWSVRIDPDAAPATEPQSVALTRVSTASDWRFADPAPR